MQLLQDSHKKLMSAYDLLSQGSISVASFENIRTVIKGVHPEIDKKLEVCSIGLAKLQKFQTGDVISLTVEGLPEETEEKKKRKKALLFFINSIKNLQSEIKRIEKELSSQKNQSSGNQVKSWGRIIGRAKGPIGLVTLAAIVIVGIILLTHSGKSTSLRQDQSGPTKSLVKAIMFNGKQIPLSQLRIGQMGTHCDNEPHYHALSLDGIVTSTDGTKIQDPEGCGFGKVKDTQVVEVQQ